MVCGQGAGAPTFFRYSCILIQIPTSQIYFPSLLVFYSIAWSVVVLVWILIEQALMDLNLQVLIYH